jgi:hypothetical protein
LNIPEGNRLGGETQSMEDGFNDLKDEISTLMINVFDWPFFLGGGAEKV